MRNRWARLRLVCCVACSMMAGCGVLRSQRVVSSTHGMPAIRPISCGSAGQAPQRAFEFTAPGDGYYAFESRTRDYDGVLAIWDPNGQELGCNDDAGSTRRSRIDLLLVEGQTVEIIQGGYSGAAGTFELQVRTGDDVGGELRIEPLGQGSYVLTQ
ncbi:MAG: hypothetical protein M3Y87_06385 [Myxococcota bacterium]|nr:hypothetical protein [Myxococcota bacterium]